MPKATKDSKSGSKTNTGRIGTRSSTRNAKEGQENLGPVIAAQAASSSQAATMGREPPLSARAERRLNRETKLYGLAEDSEMKAHWKTASMEDLRSENTRLERKVLKLKEKVRASRVQLEASEAHLRATVEENEAMKKEVEGLRQTMANTWEMKEKCREGLVEAQAEIERLEEAIAQGEYPHGYGQQPSWKGPYLK